MTFRRTNLLVLCKTYPSPSAGYVETSCVAGTETDGRLVRLYPVPFRLLDDQSQFRKWQWIEVDIEKAPADHRRESYRIRGDTIKCLGEPLSTKDSWAARRHYLSQVETFDDFVGLEQARVKRGVTLGLLAGQEILSLEIAAARNPEWSEDERQKLSQSQGDLFAVADAVALHALRKVPFDFHYRYRTSAPIEGTEHRHKIVDWEAGALYWNLVESHGAGWEAPFRDKYGRQFSDKDLIFLMGTIHRFPDQWLIVSVIYPPKQRQQSLDLE
jgi:hypothetical protein